MKMIGEEEGEGEIGFNVLYGRAALYDRVTLWVGVWSGVV